MPDGSIPEIEERVARDRAELAQSLDTLSNTLAPEYLSRQASELFETYGSDLGQQAWGAARQNPAAFALVGAGLALLLSGTGNRADGAGIAPAPEGPVQEPPVAVPPEEAMEGFHDRVASADAQMRNEAQTAVPHKPASAQRLRAALHAGLEKLPPEAQVRILNAREAAISAQEVVERRAAKAAGQAQRIATENPIACAAAAFGLGALVASLVPSTRREDEMLGAHRDAMMAQAQDALQAETARVGEAVSDALAGSDAPSQDTGRQDKGLQVPS